MKHFDYSPHEGKKFQFLGRVMGFSLCQAPTSIGYDCISTILTGLVENSSQARPTSISMELERMGKVHVGKDRCGGTQPF